MTSLPAAIIGLALPLCSGWLLARLLEGRVPVLSLPERLGLSAAFGVTGTMWLTILLSAWTGLGLGLPTLLGVQLAALGGLWWLVKRQRLDWGATVATEDTAPRWLRLGLWALLGVSVLKVVTLASVLTFGVPTFFDDARDNWNLRAKLIVAEGQLPSALPMEDPATAGGGVVSYPSTLPLLKAWLVTLGGEWSEPVVNGVQLLWLVAVVLLVGGTVARRQGRTTGVAAAIALLGLPLLLIHGLHSYADLFLAVQLTAAGLCGYEAATQEERDSALSWLRLGAVACALLPATKNEGLLLYLPLALALLGAATWRQYRRGLLQGRDVRSVAALTLGLIAVLVLPWIAYKWQQGLVFANSRSVDSFAIAWQPQAATAVLYHFTHEGNWLLLPAFAVALLAVSWRRAIGRLRPLTTFCVALLLLTVCLYLFTDLGQAAVDQTGFGRGIVHLAPLWVLLTALLLPINEEEA